MRRALSSLLLLWLAGPASAGPLRLGVETEEPVRGPFLVRVQGHYADFHNGHSRHWKDALIPAGGRHWIPLGPVNPLLNMGVSVTVFHPEYRLEHARSRKTPLLLRPVRFESFRPRAWRDLIEGGAEAAVAELKARSEHPLFQAIGQLQIFLEAYLPAVDDADPPPVSEAELREQLRLLQQLDAFVHSLPPAPSLPVYGKRTPEEQAELVRYHARQELEIRADLAELTRRAGAWLTLPRAERGAVRRAMRAMRTPRGLGEELLTSDDLARIGAFLDRYSADREARRDPERRMSWTTPDTRITYRVGVVDPPPGCAYLSVSTDLTTMTSADLGDMGASVKLRFCQQRTGVWRYEQP